MSKMTNNTSGIETLRDRIRTSADITDDDRENLLAFSDEMTFRKTDYSDGRHVKLLQHCTMLAGDSQKYDLDELPAPSLTDALEDDEAAKDIVRWVNRHYDNEETNRDFRVAIRMFGEHVTPGEGKPASIEQISADTSRNYNPMPDPAKMLYWDEHIQPMLDNANTRDQAAIAVAWDLGPRSEEFETVRLGDIADSRYGLRISLDGKRGQRSPIIIPSVPYLQRWRADHPRRGDPSAPLWCNLNTGEEISYKMFLKMIKKPAERAGVTHTDITYRRMRKSSASYLASQNTNQPHLEDHHGWKRGSKVAARYIAVFSDANEREIARAHGVDVSADEPDPIAPLECPRCDRKTPRHEDICVWCGQALSHGAVAQLEEDEREVDRALLRLAREDPALLEEAEQRQQIVTAIEDDPELRERAWELIDAADGDGTET